MLWFFYCTTDNQLEFEDNSLKFKLTVLEFWLDVQYQDLLSTQSLRLQLGQIPAQYRQRGATPSYPTRSTAI